MNAVEQSLKASLSARAMSMDLDKASLKLRGQEIVDNSGADGATAVHLTRVHSLSHAENVESRKQRGYGTWLPVAACAAGALALSIAVFASGDGASVTPATPGPAVIEAMTRPQEGSDLPAMRGLPEEVSRDSIRLLATTSGVQFLVGTTANGRTCFSAVAEYAETSTCTMGGGLSAGESLEVELPSMGVTAWLIPTNTSSRTATEAGAQEVTQNLWIKVVSA